MGFSINGNYGLGKIRNYETNVVVRMLDTVAPVTFHISCYMTSEQKDNIVHALQESSIKFLNFAFSDYGINLGVNDITIGKLISRLRDLMNQFADILSMNGAMDSNHCPICGIELTAENKKTKSIDGFVITMDSDCAAKIDATIISENEAYKNTPNNYLNGFFGALIGGFAGAVIAFILSMIGVVSAISSFIAVLLGAKLYQIFKGKQNAMMIVIVAGTSLLCMIGVVLWIYTTAAFGIGSEMSFLFPTPWQAFLYFMSQDPDFAAAFRNDLVLTILFSLLGIGYKIVSMARSLKRKTVVGS